jgi:aldehyde:ferredoxin oxidoreductase
VMTNDPLRLLRVDLSSLTTAVEEIPAEIGEAFIGGKGLVTYYLYRELDPGTTPLDPANKIFIAPGALCGTLTPAASRYEMATLSPLTGIYLDSNSGGHFGVELKTSGFDLVILEGKAENPVYILIRNQKVEIRSADHLWGKTIYETENMLREELGDPRFKIASIGTAGERLVRFACVGNDYSRQIGRGGVGAVWGSKGLKAIAVLGTQIKSAADPDRFKQAIDQALENIFNNDWVHHKRAHGTIGSLDVMHHLGITPVANFTRAVFDPIDKIDSTVFDDLVSSRLACASCPVACSKGTRGKMGDEIEGPEYETAALFGPNCEVEDPQIIIRANAICNQVGLDTISAGTIIGMVLNAADIGRISWTELGLSPKQDRGSMVLDLLELISKREGIGDLLAEGALAAGRILGLEDLVPQVKGMEFPAYDPRVSEGMALAYMTSDRGACHLRTYPFGREISGELPRHGYQEKAEFVKRQQDEKAAQECLGVCQFPYGIGLLTDDLPNLLSALTGQEWTYEKLCRTGERIWNLSRSFNALLGIKRADDYLPKRFTEKEMPDGMGEGEIISRSDQDQLLEAYYQLRTWDDQGLPTEEGWQKLDLSGLVGELPEYS